MVLIGTAVNFASRVPTTISLIRVGSGAMVLLLLAPSYPEHSRKGVVGIVKTGAHGTTEQMGAVVYSWIVVVLRLESQNRIE
jgi:hypothetical protein